MSTSSAGGLSRRLGTFDAVVIGLGSMIGAGVFATVGPAAEAAGSGLLLGVVLAAGVAYANATSSAQLAAVHPESGGTYVYGRRQLGPFWGYLAGWSFVVGKTASCAAMALTVGAYAWPGAARPLAVAAVVGLTAVNYRGIAKTAWLTRAIVAVVLAALAGVVIAVVAGGAAEPRLLVGGLGAATPYGVLQAGGLWFFAFAGYARIATLGEEVAEPQRTIPRAIPLALGLTLVVYAAVATSALAALGAGALTAVDAPLAAAVETGRFAEAAWLVRLGATVASLGVLLSLLAGVSRTTLAMARDRELPGWLDAVHPRHHVPHRAELVVAAVVVALVLIGDLRGAIGFSSFAVLVYYAIANVSALTLSAQQRRWPRPLAALGVAGCGMLAVTLPLVSVLGGAAVLAVGALAWAVRHRPGGGRQRHPPRFE
jgi:APA family basic amino acid/polyamine antiporter